MKVTYKASHDNKTFETEDEARAYVAEAKKANKDDRNFYSYVHFIYKPETELEKEFEALISPAHEEINAKLKEANKLLDEAEAIAEKYGMPFESDISPVANNYTPRSFEDRWGVLDRDFVSDLLSSYDAHVSADWAGWQHSAVC